MWVSTRLSRGYAGTLSAAQESAFAPGLSFAGKSVLDVGCNCGIVAYEISKQAPKLIHGVDIEPRCIFTARMIFQGVPVESRFDCVDLGNERKLTAAIRDDYEVVLFLRVYKQLRRRHGEAKARAAVTHIARHTIGTMIAKVRGRLMAEEVVPAAAAGGLGKVEHLTDANGQPIEIAVFSRTGG